MADSKKHNAIILSIHPKYAEAILNGSKTVEFRKKNIPLDVRHVVLYATSPVRHVVGYFSISETVPTTPSRLWQRFNGTGGISHELFQEYYSGSTTAVAMVIGQAWRLSRQIKLESIDGKAIPPNSFRYLEASALNRIVKRKSSKVLSSKVG